MFLSEPNVEKCIRAYLTDKGWKISNSPKTAGAHGADIIASHPRWRKRYIIETKGRNKRHPSQARHNAFWSVLGQILSRIEIEGNHPKKARRYGIGIPKGWEKMFRNKMHKMKGGWALLKLHVFLVDDDGNVEEKSYRHFLK